MRQASPRNSEAESEEEHSLLSSDRLANASEHGAQASYWQRFLYSLLFVLFASQFELSNAVLAQLRPCERGFMPASPWIGCDWSDSPQYVWLQGLGYTFLALYVVGIPLLFSLLLFSRRKAIREGSEKVEHQMGFLYETYKREVFYFEVIWLVRRVLLSLAIALVPSSSGMRGAVIAFILFASLFVQQKFQPFSSPAVNTFETISTTTMLYSFFVGSQASESKSDLRPVLQTVLWVLNALVVFMLSVALVAPALQRLLSRCCPRCCSRKQMIRLNMPDNE